jgi:proline iminopeptidase
MFETFDRQEHNYGFRSDDWKGENMCLSTGVLSQAGFDIPYSVRGKKIAPRAGRETLLAIDLPGGPGSVLTSQWRSNTSPEQYRVATANWRGVGDTTPFASIENNRTERLIEDIDALRIAASQGRDEPVVIRGGSWGATMGLMYAAARPDKVAGLVLRLPFLASGADISHNYAADGHLAQRHPDAYENFRQATKKDNPLEGMLMLAEEMGHKDERRVKAAFVAATAWEYARNGEKYMPPEGAPDPQAVARARVMAHYSGNQFFMPSEGAAAAFSKLRKDMPIIIIGHEDDPLCIPNTLTKFAQGLPHAEMYLYGANWHWVAKENENSAIGFDNSFIIDGYRFSMARMGLALEGRLQLKPGVTHYARPGNSAGMK